MAKILPSLQLPGPTKNSSGPKRKWWTIKLRFGTTLSPIPGLYATPGAMIPSIQTSVTKKNCRHPRLERTRGNEDHLQLSLERMNRFDAAIFTVLQGSNLHIPQISFARELHIVVKQIPVAIDLNNGVLVGPAIHGV